MELNGSIGRFKGIRLLTIGMDNAWTLRAMMHMSMDVMDLTIRVGTFRRENMLRYRDLRIKHEYSIDITRN